MVTQSLSNQHFNSTSLDHLHISSVNQGHSVAFAAALSSKATVLPPQQLFRLSRNHAFLTPHWDYDADHPSRKPFQDKGVLGNRNAHLGK